MRLIIFSQPSIFIRGHLHAHLFGFILTSPDKHAWSCLDRIHPVLEFHPSVDMGTSSSRINSLPVRAMIVTFLCHFGSVSSFTRTSRDVARSRLRPLFLKTKLPVISTPLAVEDEGSPVLAFFSAACKLCSQNSGQCLLFADAHSFCPDVRTYAHSCCQGVDRVVW